MAKRYGLAQRGLMFWIIVAWGVGPQWTIAETAKSSGQSGYAFQVDVPEPRFLAHQDGSSKIEIEGFGTKERRPGAPNLPSKTFLIAIPPGTKSGQKLRLRGRGVPSSAGRPAGDLLVVVQIQPPKQLDERSREIMEEFERLNPGP